jgi:hypothetical protein
MTELTIKIYESIEEPGYFYDLFDAVDNLDDAHLIEGGHCTTTIENALEMAYADAKKVLVRN